MAGWRTDYRVSFPTQRNHLPDLKLRSTKGEKQGGPQGQSGRQIRYQVPMHDMRAAGFGSRTQTNEVQGADPAPRPTALCHEALVKTGGNNYTMNRVIINAHKEK